MTLKLFDFEKSDNSLTKLTQLEKYGSLDNFADNFLLLWES